VNVIDRLLFHPPAVAAKDSANEATSSSHLSPKSGPISQAKDRAGKLDELCKALSREGFQLSWKVQGAKGADRTKLNELNTGVNLEMSINGKPSFIWQFMPGHFIVQEIHQGRQSWKDQVGEEMAKRLSAQSPANEKAFSPLLFHWFSNEKNWDQIGSRLNQGNVQESLLYGLPLSSNETKLFAFQKILSSVHAKSMKNFATRIQGQLPTNDPYTQQTIHSALADADFPFGDPPHALGKPDAVYTRVNPAKLREKYGEESAKKMGRSWERVMYGHKIAIGEPLLRENGEELHVPFEEAKKACLELNPEKDREKVKKAFLEREAALDKIRKAPDLNAAQKEEELKKIHTEMPIPGIYLMSKEEWKIIAGDFSHRENRYISQILPKLNSRLFWSSSGVPYDANFAFYFSGSHGYVYDDNRNYGRQVRCGGGVAWVK
jgi:hypothetical protein